MLSVSFSPAELLSRYPQSGGHAGSWVFFAFYDQHHIYLYPKDFEKLEVSWKGNVCIVTLPASH